MAAENRLSSRRSRVFKGFSLFILLVTAGYVWLVLQSGANILNYIAILFVFLMAMACYIAGSQRLLERFNTRWEWAGGLAVAFMMGFQLANHASRILGDSRSGRQFELATLDGYILILFTAVFVFMVITLIYSYYKPAIMFND